MSRYTYTIISKYTILKQILIGQQGVWKTILFSQYISNLASKAEDICKI